MAVVFLILGMALFGSATPVSKIVGGELPVFLGSFLRVSIATLALFPFVAKDFKKNFKKIDKIDKSDWKFIALIALFGMFGFTVFLMWGMKHVSGVAGSIVMSITPALTALGARIALKSPLNKRKIWAIGLGVGGVIIVNLFKGKFSSDGGAMFYLGIFAVFLAICCEATYTLAGKRVTDDVEPLFASFMALLLSLALFLPLAWWEYDPALWGRVSGRAWWALGFWGAGTLALGSALWYKGLSLASGATAAGFMSVMPISALILSYFLLGESFHPVHLVGIGLVLLSVGIMSRDHYLSMQDEV